MLQKSVTLSVLILRAKEWLDDQAKLSSDLLPVIDLAKDRLNLLCAALNSTGICQMDSEEATHLPLEDQVELDTIAREINWRLVELSRIVCMRASLMGEKAVEFAAEFEAHLALEPDAFDGA